ncbi:MAG: Na+/H+ antiporter NhaA [Betaproteobacteria bacterium]|nr:MAG: Na+/H+ antiporter NhaA [Betaproteobacteria bacterium]
MAASHSDRRFFGFLPEAALPGALLVATAIAAMIVVNSPLGGGYQSILASKVAIGPGEFSIDMKVSDWIKNALMAIFFFFVGLELKRELLEGQLSNAKAALLPMLAAAGGMAAPALLFLLFAGGAGFGRGWAIPAATDIAFALGVLSLLGNRVPASLKAFLLAVAVVDDLGAILIVAFFYTDTVHTTPLMIAAGITGLLFAINRLRVASIPVYLIIGVVLWIFMYQSGISATIAGVVVAAFVPLKAKDGTSPLHNAEHAFRPWVMFLVMPIFAFANAGVDLRGASAYFTHPITLGAAFGLALGKPVGILLMTWVGAKLVRATVPGTWIQIVGVGFIAGIGFTMSLFIGALAFTDPTLATPVRLGVYAGSIASAVVGLIILARTLPSSGAAPAVSTDETSHVMLGR